MKGSGQQSSLRPFVSPLAALAISLGSAIGWGSLVVTSNNYLVNSGPLGSVLGLIIGAAVMIVIGKNYSYLMGLYPDAGGAYTFTKNAFGYDHGFLTGWFLFLTYIAIFWANATSLPLFARYFFGNVFRFGYMYSIFGYDVYLGELLLTIAAIAIFALFCINFRRLLTYVMIALGVVFTLGIVICFAAAVSGHGGSYMSYEPLFAPGSSDIMQVARIACISPWAFIGFESISHLTEEITFDRSRVSRILTVSVIVSTALYIFITILSVTAYPPEYRSWLDYIKDIGDLSGIKGLPAFYAANYYLGSKGVTILMITLLALIITSLIGTLLAVSRLCYAAAKDDILPERFSELNKKNIPHKALILIAAISVMIPFFGRTAIGWIVDVTTIGSTIIYGFVSASAAKIAKDNKDKNIVVFGITGVIVMVIFGAYLLIPELFSLGSIERETYFLFTVWTLLGFVFFRYILKKDTENRFGRSIVVWIALLALILFTSLVWLSKSTMSLTSGTLESVNEYFKGIIGHDQFKDLAKSFMDNKLDEVRESNFRSVLVVAGFFSVAIVILINNYSLMKKRLVENQAALEHVTNVANIDPLTGVKSKHAYAMGERLVNEEIETGLINEFAVAVCDVNGLKHINDTQGHKAGDEYICAASKLICDHFMHSPVYRIGGDEFAVFLTGTDYHDRHEILLELNKKVEAAIINGGAIVSVGISEYIEGEDTEVRNVFERADELMYRRKKQLKAMGAITRG